MSDTIIKWNAEAGTRFLTIRQDGSFNLNEETPPLYALGELAKAFVRQKDRIKRLEKAGDNLLTVMRGEEAAAYCEWVALAREAELNWCKAKEAKP